MTEELEEYILRHIDKEGETLSRLDRETHLYHLRPRMCSGHLQGKLLKMFVRMIRPKRILELGTFTGYSALAMAEGLVPGRSCTQSKSTTSWRISSESISARRNRGKTSTCTSATPAT